MISLGRNQGTRHNDVITYFKNEKTLENRVISEESDKGHGRIEQRIAYSFEDIDWLKKEHE